MSSRIMFFVIFVWCLASPANGFNPRVSTVVNGQIDFDGITLAEAIYLDGRVVEARLTVCELPDGAMLFCACGFTNDTLKQCFVRGRVQPDNGDQIVVKGRLNVRRWRGDIWMVSLDGVQKR